jgi:holo-[acyl-carrier protein] synthase
LILGIGTDLCEIARIRSAEDRFGERFARKILVADELIRYRRHVKPAAYLAKRFAAKEAFSKALGTGIRYPVSWRQLAVVNSPTGRPMFRFSDELQSLLNRKGVTAVHLSITDETGIAGAYVMVEGRE